MKEHLTKIYDLLNDKLSEIIPELNPKKSGGKHYLKCSKCEDKSAFYYPNSRLIMCNHRTSCGLKISLWDYLAEREGWKDNGEALRGLATLAGYSLPPQSPEQIERQNVRRLESQQREAAFLMFRCWFDFEPEAMSAREYLKGRGWTTNEIDGEIQEVGFFSQKRLESGIIDGTITPGPVLEYIKKIRPSTWPETYALVIPWRGPSGEIETFQFRAIDNTAAPPYLFAPGENKGHILFNLNEARRARTDEIYIVEGIIDALRLTAGGLPNVVALGGRDLNEKHLEALKAAKFKHIILMLDNDGPGIDGTIKAIRMLSGAGLNSTFLQLPASVKDPDEFLRKGGTVAELTGLKQVGGLSWLAEKIMRTSGKSIIENRKAFDGVIELAETSKPHLEDYKELFKTLERYGTAPDIVEDIYQGITTKKKAEAETEKINQVLTNAQRKAASGATPAEILKMLESLKPETADKKPVKSFIDYLHEKREIERKRDPQKPLGLPLTKFKNIEFQTDGIQSGLYLIGAGPNVGKTAFSVNLAIDLIRTNRDLAIYFYTLDDTKGIIVNRFLGALTSFQINQIQKGFKTSEEDNQKIDEAYGTLASWHKQGRLYIKDIEEIKHIADIESDVRSQKEAGRKTVVFVDALYNLEVESNTPGGIREMNIDRAAQIKGIVDRLDIPLFCTVEVRKQGKKDPKKVAIELTLDDIMETGKFAYNANLVWFLEGDRKEDEPDAAAIEVKISCKKNKLNYDKRTRNLMFYPQTSIIDEVKGTLGRV